MIPLTEMLVAEQQACGSVARPAPFLLRAEVTAVDPERGQVGLRIAGQPEAQHLVGCLLQTTEAAPLRLVVGDEVLAFRDGVGAESDRAVVLGRIGAPRPACNEAPDETLLEAKEQLTLVCGAASLTLRKDGKILLQGEDVVTRARRRHRIKGASVSIN